MNEAVLKEVSSNGKPSQGSNQASPAHPNQQEANQQEFHSDKEIKSSMTPHFKEFILLKSPKAINHIGDIEIDSINEITQREIKELKYFKVPKSPKAINHIGDIEIDSIDESTQRENEDQPNSNSEKVKNQRLTPQLTKPKSPELQDLDQEIAQMPKTFIQVTEIEIKKLKQSCRRGLSEQPLSMDTKKFQTTFKMGAAIPAYFKLIMIMVVFLTVWFTLVGYIGFQATYLGAGNCPGMKVMLTDFGNGKCGIIFQKFPQWMDSSEWPQQNLLDQCAEYYDKFPKYTDCTDHSQCSEKDTFCSFDGWGKCLPCRKCLLCESGSDFTCGQCYEGKTIPGRHQYSCVEPAQKCSAHEQCPDNFFCNIDRECEVCYRCSLCSNGLNNNCGKCDPNQYPTEEDEPCSKKPQTSRALSRFYSIDMGEDYFNPPKTSNFPQRLDELTKLFFLGLLSSKGNFSNYFIDSYGLAAMQQTYPEIFTDEVITALRVRDSQGRDCQANFLKRTLNCKDGIIDGSEFFQTMLALENLYPTEQQQKDIKLKCCQVMVHEECMSCGSLSFKISSLNRLDLFGDGWYIPKTYAVKDSERIKLASFVVCVMIIISYFYFSNFVRQVDKETITPSDFCILVRNVTKKRFELQEFSCFLKKEGLVKENTNLTLMQPFEIDNDPKITRENIEATLLKLGQKSVKEKDKEKLQKELKKLKQKYLQKGNLVPLVFLLFENDQAAFDTFKLLSTTKKKFLGNKLQVERPENPQNINWSNLKYSGQTGRTIIIYFLAFQTIEEVFELMCIVNNNTRHMNSTVRSVLIIMANTWGHQWIILLLKLSKPLTKTSAIIRSVNVSTVAIIANYIILNVYLTYLKLSPVYDGIQDCKSMDEVTGEIFELLVILMIIGPIKELIVQGFVMTVIQKALLAKHSKSEDPRLTQSQVEAKLLPREINLEARIASVNKVFLLCAFYHFMFPIISVIGIISLLLQFVVDKYLLLRVYKLPRYPLESTLIWNQLKIILLFGILVLFGAYMQFRYIDQIWLPEEFERKMAANSFYHTRSHISEAIRQFQILITVTCIVLYTIHSRSETYQKSDKPQYYKDQSFETTYLNAIGRWRSRVYRENAEESLILEKKEKAK